MSSPSPLNTIIRAGAGAGKTTRLIEEVYKLFSSFKRKNETWPRLVLTTFSNKATQEINERLLKKAIETNDANFFEYINSKSHLLVSTIHGVLHLFISQNQSEFGLTKDFKIVNDVEITRRQQKLFRNLITSVPEAAALLEIYNLSELYSLVRNYQFFKLTEGNLRPFSEQAFSEYIEKLRLEIKRGFQLAVPILRSATLSKSWAASVAGFPSIEGKDFILDILNWEDTIRLPTVPQKGELDVLLAQAQFVAAIKAFRDFRDKNYHEPFLKDYQFLHSSFIKLAESFCAIAIEDRKQTQELAISDIETLCFQSDSDNSQLFKDFSLQWDFWMIDEFQDTSPIQISLLNSLIGTSRAFFVGDPQQSIYYFRGSDSRVFEDKYKELSDSGSVEVLSNNYRSHSGVLSFINDFFTKQFFQFKSMGVVKGNLGLTSDVCVYEIVDKNLLAQHTALQIKSILENDPQTPFEKIVVLSRTNRDLESLAEQFKDLGIPHYVHSQGQFFRQREVLDLLFFAKFLMDPQDISNLAFLFKTPTVGMNSEEIKRVLGGFENWENLVLSYENKKGQIAESIQRLDKYFKKSVHIGIIETIQIFAVNEGAFVLSTLSDSSGKKESNIWKLIYWLKEELEKGIESFLIQMDMVLNPNKNETYEESENQAIIEPAKIQMMTIHASKGLQFSHVVLIGLNSSPKLRARFSLDVDTTTKEFSLFIKTADKDDKIRSPIHWQQAAIQKEREAEEFERLLYVALTRAEKRISVFTLAKISEASWARRFSDFYLKQRAETEIASFKMEWIKIEPNELESVPGVDLPAALVKPNESNTQNLLLNPFFSKIDELLEESQKQGPISFSSSKSARQIDLHQIMISQRGIGIHRLREKGIVDFSYYPKLEFSKDFDSLFAGGFKEYRFTFKYGHYQFSGSIDFVYLTEGRVLIVDYKSGASSQNELYKQQLEFYAECLSYFKKLKSDCIFDLVIDYIDQRKIEYFSYRSVGASQYFDKFLLARELENITG